MLDKFDSKYSLVVLIAKRARLLEEGSERLIDCSADNSVTVAINEIAKGKITYSRD
jgi:DNA-directed RNA polymerase subunit omega